LEPDPNVIGTKPQSFTEATEVSIHSLASNATSEGEYSENTQIISGNTKPDSTTGNKIDLTEATKPQVNTQATDPAEKPNLPNLPNLPTLPIGPQLPPTSDTPKPPVIVVPTLPIVTDPVEVPGITDGVPDDKPADTDIPQSNGTGVPWPPTTAAPTEPPQDSPPPVNDSTHAPEQSDPAWFDEPTEAPMTTEPCWTVSPAEPTEPTCAATMPAAPETQSPTAKISVYGKILDQNGGVVKGAKVTLYNNGTAIATVKTNSNGDYTFAGVNYTSGLYVKQTYAPSGYTSATNSVYVGSPNDYGSNYIVFVCTKN